jgi:DNA-3-methyladenine glycosylase II
LHEETGYFHPAPPFDFAKSLAFLGDFAPMRGEQTVAPGSLRKAVGVEGTAAAFEVSSAGTVEEPRLSYTLYSEEQLSTARREAALDRVAFFLSLADDLRTFYALAGEDPVFAPVAEGLYGYHQVKFLTPFESACWAVLSQRSPMAMSLRMKAALVEACGGGIRVKGELLRSFPEPEQVAALGPDGLRELIRNERRAESLGAVAHAFAEVDERFLRTAPYAEVGTWLRSIRGIGEWSASFVLLRGLGRMERVPLTEQRLLDAASRLYGRGETVTGEGLERLARPYGAWQGYWAHYLRVAS